jgi:predicted CXXCH cytochrome family protein
MARANVTGSKHDFSGQGWGTNEICVFCHTPHNANTAIAGSPLWNHQVTAATYTLYTSPSLRNPTSQPRGPSKRCLSCHDGAVAIDSYGTHSGTHFVTGPANLGTDLGNDHPVSVSWTHQTLAPGAPSCGTCHIGGHGGWAPMPLPFYGGSVECPTCHEPHDKGAETKMLRKALTGSAICLHCHGK